jgi:transcriptional regulator with XRE-family HTH domain
MRLRSCSALYKNRKTSQGNTLAIAATKGDSLPLLDICGSTGTGRRLTMQRRIDGYDIRQSFSRNLKLYRGKLNLSQLALSQKAGITHNFVNDIENCKKWASPETINKLAVALEIEPYQLFMTNPLDEKRTRRLHLQLDELNERFNQAVCEIKESYLLIEDD